MVKLQIIVFAILLSICNNIEAQKFSQTLRKTFLEKTMKNKIRTEVKEILENPELLQDMQGEQQQKTIAFLEKTINNQNENNITNTPETESEIHAAINPKDSNNIIVSAMKWTPSFLGYSLTFPVYYTNDFGTTWNLGKFDGMDRSFLNIGGGDPVISYDSEGTAYLTWLTVDIGFNPLIGITLHWASSTDGGANWTYGSDLIDQGAILDLFGNDGSRLVDKEWTAVDLSDSPSKNTFYIAYAEIDVIDTTYQILLKKKTPTANQLSPAMRVSSEDILFAQFSSIDVDSDGNVHILFTGATEQDSVLGLYHSYSEDGGQTFRQTRITDIVVPCLFETEEACSIVGIDVGRMYPCPHLKVDRSGGEYDGRIYTVWTATGTSTERTSGADIYYSYSSDKGITWSQPIVLNNDSSKTAHQFFSNLSVNDKGILSVGWYDRREDPANIDTHYYMTYSINGGQTFKDDFAVSQRAADFTKIGNRNGNFGVGEYTQIISSSNYAIPFWADGSTNDGNIEVVMAKIPLAQSSSNENITMHSLKTLSVKIVVHQIYPNPTEGDINLKIYLDQADDVEIRIYDKLGKIHFERTLRDLPKGQNHVNLNIRDLQAGNYSILVKSPFGYTMENIILAK